MKTKEKLKVIFEEHVKLVEPVIEELLLDSVDPRHKEAILLQIASGGKRLRPVLAMITCQLMGGKIEDVIYPAAGLEIIHNYTLIVDDIIDHSEFRRNRPTVWKKYGTSIADLFGVYYVSAAFQSLTKTKNSVKLLEILTKTLKRITDGQILDVFYEKSGRKEELYVVENRFSKVTTDEYVDMIGGKTASLFSSCCVVGGVCADILEIDSKHLNDFGLNFGLAFQIKDDLLDVFGDEKTFGKEVGKDIKEKKVSNIVILLALEELKGSDKREIEDILNMEIIGKKEVERTTVLIEKSRARARAEKMGEEFIEKSKEALKNLPQNKWNELLSDLANYIIKREV